MALLSSNELLKMINASVDATLKKHDIPDTPAARIDTLMGMYKIISTEGATGQHDSLILREIEDEVLRLNFLVL